MKKLHFLTWGFIIVGLVLLVASSVWFGKFHNPSEYLLYLGGAVLLLVLSGFVEAFKTLGDAQRKTNENQLEIQRWITEQERLKEE